MNAPSERPSTWPRQFVLLALLFLLPLVIAMWLYYGGRVLQPEGQTNHGAILEPIVNLGEALPNSRASALADGRWLLVYANSGECKTGCRDALYRLRQSRLMLGKDMSRVQRIFLHGPAAPDTVFLEQHPGLLLVEDREWSRLLAERKPLHLAPGGFFLVDPLGNLVMYFAPDIVPGDMVDDIEHLLDLSQIG
jgi:hypothetical protein